MEWAAVSACAVAISCCASAICFSICATLVRSSSTSFSLSVWRSSCDCSRSACICAVKSGKSTFRFCKFQRNSPICSPSVPCCSPNAPCASPKAPCLSPSSPCCRPNSACAANASRARFTVAGSVMMYDFPSRSNQMKSVFNLSRKACSCAKSICENDPLMVDDPAEMIAYESPPSVEYE